MSEHLFSGPSVYEIKDNIVRKAHANVLSLSDGVFKNQATLNQMLDSIRQQSRIDVPVLAFDQRKGKRRQDGKRNLVDVTIPFRGQEAAFRIAPRSSTMGARADVSPSYIVIALDDNDRLEAELEARVTVISNNLKNLTADLSTLSKEVQDAIDNAVERRMGEVKRRAELDASRSFPIE